jgi:predicted TIM-barrel fold metal-dependent hydrolase
VDGAWDCHVHVFDAQAQASASVSVSVSARSSHYTPVHSSLNEIEQLAEAHGVRHLVLVQPSIYGVDNSVLLRALQAEPGRHRGVAVVDASVSDGELDRLHAAGVCGVRFNLVSPAGQAGHAAELESELLELSAKLRERDMHVQWYVQAHMLAQLAKWQQATGLRFVLDHLAGLKASIRPDDAVWAAAQALADGGAWIKLSGWYRLDATAPYTELHSTIQRVASMFGHHMVWGSDWPHTSFEPPHRPSFDSNLHPVRSALGDAALHAAMHDQARALYFNHPASA